MLGLGLLISTICTLITPFVAHQGPVWLIITRFILGLGQVIIKFIILLRQINFSIAFLNVAVINKIINFCNFL